MNSTDALPKKIAVLMGGPSSERDVSLATGRGVSKALHSLGVEVAEVDVRDENFQLPGDVDFAFITLHWNFRRGRPAPGAFGTARCRLHRRRSRGELAGFRQDSVERKI